MIMIFFLFFFFFYNECTFCSQTNSKTYYIWIRKSFYFKPAIFRDADSTAIVPSFVISHSGQSEGGVWGGGGERGLVAVETSVVSQLPICGQFEMLTSAFFHVHYESPRWAQRPALDCFIYPDAPAVERMLRPRQCVMRKRRRDARMSQTSFFRREDCDLSVNVCWHLYSTASSPNSYCLKVAEYLMKSWVHVSKFSIFL